MNRTLWTFVFCALFFKNMIEACSPCTCRSAFMCSGQGIDCSSKALTRVPTNLPSDTCELNLYNNALTGIEDNAFSYLEKLERLYLDGNKINAIKNSTFTGLTNLKVLDLNDNNIATIEENAFNDLTKLESLYLNDNSITTENNTFNDLTNLKSLSISDNPFHCDCELKGLVDFLQSGRVSVSGNPQCSTPKNLNGILLVSLSLSAANLTCPDMTTVHTTIPETSPDLTTMPTTIPETSPDMTTVHTPIPKTESETINTTAEFMETTYNLETNCSPLEVGNILVVTHLSLCLIVKTMIEL